MKPDQIWLDLSKETVRVWVNSTLGLAHAKGSSAQRVGFFREIPLYHLPSSSADPMGWTSFAWVDIIGKFGLDEEFWVSLEAARFALLSPPTEMANLNPPLAVVFPLAHDVLFFGGTFDPWHQGHKACLDLAPQEMPLIVCPDRNPHKISRVGDGLKHYLVLEKIIPRKPSLYIYPGFLLKDDPNPTVTWVLRVKRNRPDIRIHLLMGHDSFLSLETWTQATELMKLISGLHVVSRLEEDSSHEESVKWVLAQNDKIEIKFLGHHAFEGLASRNLR